MKKILIIGNSPLPNENTKSRPAAGLRTYQFLTPLTRNQRDFSVELVSIAMPESYEEPLDEHKTVYRENFSQFFISKNNPQLLKRIQRIHDQFEPEIIIGVNTYPSYIASLLDSSAAFWADLNGWIMAEAQAQAYKIESNDYLQHYYNFEKNILARADKFSTVSVAQKFAVTGELAMLGRLGKESFGYEFVHHVPNATEFLPGEEQRAGLTESEETMMEKIPENAFVALWVGGYNAWVDEKILFEALNEAMDKCEKLVFVSTGGMVEGLDNKTFTNFKRAVEGCRHRERFVFLGWVATSFIPYMYSRANIGINVDKYCTETITGARNRINEMMKFGLPLVTTLGSEISHEVMRVGAGIAVKSGNHELIASAIEKFYGAWKNRKSETNDWPRKCGEEGAKYIKEFCSYEYTLAPLLEWLKRPSCAPDKNLSLDLTKKNRLRAGWLYLKQNGLRKSLRKLM